MARPSIQTFVFMDFGTEYNNPKAVTEVSLLAVPRILYLDPDTTEETKKLTISPQDWWQNGSNLKAYMAIKDFINEQKPVCLVAHNGNRFDFPILQRGLQESNVSLSDDVLCADSLYAYYDILENLMRPLVFEGSAVRNIFYEGADRPEASYRLGDIYERVVTYPRVVPHPPENDNLMNFKISLKLAESFLAWTDQIQREFADVEPGELDMNF